MGLLIVLGLGTLAYLHYSGQLTPHLWRRLGIAALGLIAARFLFGGRPLIGAAVAGVAFMLALRNPAPRKHSDMAIAEARDILGVGPTASAEEIAAAHRRLIAQVHPDKGGSAELARRVNAARDVLLAAVNRTSPGAS